jgi:hypothetical protein
MKKSNDIIGNRTRDLPACSAVHVDQGEVEIKTYEKETSLSVIYHVAFDDDRK